MIHAFLLFVFLTKDVGTKRLVSNDLYFRNLDECLLFSQKLAKQGDIVTSYCLPTLADPEKVKVY